MFFKVKCPNCGAKNSKERMTCVTCGATLTLEQVEGQLSQVSTEAEVPDKTVIEKELEERTEDEYINSERVLHKIRVTIPGWEPEEADCFVTESHLVIKAKEPITIHLSRIIGDCNIEPTGTNEKGNATFIFLDDINKEQAMTLQMEDSVLGYFKQALGDTVELPEGFFGKVKEPFRDKTRDRICTGLHRLGIDAKMAERGRPEEHVGEDFGISLGLIEIRGSPIRWLNVLKNVEYRGSGSRSVDYTIACLIPNPNIRRKMHLESIRKKSVPIFGRVIDLRWQGNFEDGMEGIFKDSSQNQSLTWLREMVRRLNEDVSLNENLIRLNTDVHILGYPEYDYWAIGSLILEWGCLETIARHLLEPVESGSTETAK